MNLMNLQLKMTVSESDSRPTTIFVTALALLSAVELAFMPIVWEYGSPCMASTF